MHRLYEFSSRFKILKGGKISLVVSALFGNAIVASASPSGGVVTSGNAIINQNGNIININQSSNKATINWNDFSIKSNETVNFNQPNKSSITLNRVVGNEKSLIDGALNANGQVWILNKNGTLFSKDAKVNTSGLLVTTKELTDEDFNKGNYNFMGDSKASIENNGSIKVNDKAYVAFVANTVKNNGIIEAYSGTINLQGADHFSLNLDDISNVSIKVTKGAIDSLVENNHILKADGGRVYLTTNAKNQLLKGVVNNTGLIEANSIDNLKSEVILFAHDGLTNVSGTISAKGGFVETSGQNLNIKDNANIDAKTWLLDPDHIIVQTNGANEKDLYYNEYYDQGGIKKIDYPNETISVSPLAVVNMLSKDGREVYLVADKSITVKENIIWNNNSMLVLSAGLTVSGGRFEGGEIIVDAIIENKNKDGGGVYFNKGINDPVDKTSFTQNGKVVINNAEQLVWIGWSPSGKYELGSNINLQNVDLQKATKDLFYGIDWYDGKGWIPIGQQYTTVTRAFTGTFDGKGYTISNLYIDRADSKYQGLFAYIGAGAIIKSVRVENVDIIAQNYSGGISGVNYGMIENSSISGNIVGTDFIGGIVGWNPSGFISNSVAAGNVRGRDYIGGFVGNNTGNIQRSYTIGNVIGNNLVGGFVGFNKGTVQNSYSTANVIGNNLVGGFAGVNDPGTVKNSYSVGKVTGNSNVRGFAGINEGILENSYYDETINPGFVEGYGNKGLRTALLYDFNTFYESDWDILVDPSLLKGYPILAWQKGRNDFVWLISDKGGTPQLPEDPGVVPQEPGNPNGPDLPTDIIQNSGKTISKQGPTDTSICYDENGMISDAVSNNLSRLNSDMKSVLICKKI